MAKLISRRYLNYCFIGLATSVALNMSACAGKDDSKKALTKGGGATAANPFEENKPAPEKQVAGVWATTDSTSTTPDLGIFSYVEAFEITLDKEGEKGGNITLYRTCETTEVPNGSTTTEGTKSKKRIKLSVKVRLNKEQLKILDGKNSDMPQTVVAPGRTTPTTQNNATTKVAINNQCGISTIKDTVFYYQISANNNTLEITNKDKSTRRAFNRTSLEAIDKNEDAIKNEREIVAQTLRGVAEGAVETGTSTDLFTRWVLKETNSQTFIYPTNKGQLSIYKYCKIANQDKGVLVTKAISSKITKTSIEIPSDLNAKKEEAGTTCEISFKKGIYAYKLKSVAVLELTLPDASAAITLQKSTEVIADPYVKKAEPAIAPPITGRGPTPQTQPPVTADNEAILRRISATPWVRETSVENQEINITINDETTPQKAKQKTTTRKLIQIKPDSSITLYGMCEEVITGFKIDDQFGMRVNVSEFKSGNVAAEFSANKIKLASTISNLDSASGAQEIRSIRTSKSAATEQALADEKQGTSNTVNLLPLDCAKFEISAGEASYVIENSVLKLTYKGANAQQITEEFTSLSIPIP